MEMWKGEMIGSENMSPAFRLPLPLPLPLPLVSLTPFSLTGA